MLTSKSPCVTLLLPETQVSLIISPKEGTTMDESLLVGWTERCHYCGSAHNVHDLEMDMDTGFCICFKCIKIQQKAEEHSISVLHGLYALEASMPDVRPKE